VHRVIVSSSAEIRHYQQVFGWPEHKVQFVPFHTDPDLIKECAPGQEDFVLAAGRTFRDYDTLLKAVSGTSIRLLIVGGAGSRAAFGGQANVSVMENIPQGELNALMRAARVIVIPLEDRAISTGQSVLLHAMGIGKAVVATRTTGTVDYVEHMVDGILVPPRDADALRTALLCMEDDQLRTRLGEAARKRVLVSGLPHQYTAAVRNAVLSFR
jgi:glycosyltransferase involved in cell wall biosynthesis